KCSCNLLWVHIDLTGGRIERFLNIDLEALIFGTSTMIGEIEALLDERVDVNRAVLAGALAGGQQHVLDNGVGALAVLDDLPEIVVQGVGEFRYFGESLGIDLRFA